MKVHRDLKSANILMNELGDAKIGMIRNSKVPPTT